MSLPYFITHKNVLVPDQEIEVTIFKYHKDLEDLVPPMPPDVPMNPYYEVADVYEPCNNSKTEFGDSIVEIIRGIGYGVWLSNIVTEVEVSVAHM